ncbi:MAG: SIS domain-containing protein [Candidatus Eremiobacteraeota bacterium]|nr:SIS domain-containing protein [Candidatus Eremiobacteraeota bacterium]
MLSHGNAAALVDVMCDQIALRDRVAETFFPVESVRIATAAKEMAERFSRGGRLITCGSGPYATDAQHVSVEFVHPVLVGKRALPALDLSVAYRDWIPAIVSADDMVMGFGPPEGDPGIQAALLDARAIGAMTIALPGNSGGYAVASPDADAHIHQEILEILTHTLYESVHVFLEHRNFGEPESPSDFLYPFLGTKTQSLEGIVEDAARSIVGKSADAARLRDRVANEELSSIAEATIAMRRQIDAGGKLLLFGNGGSATDANDWALDCVLRDGDFVPLPAISLSMEPACITAIGNDVGMDVIFLRQLIAQAKPNDVAIALSTSGGSKNVLMALAEARKRNMLTVALLGYDGGIIARDRLSDHIIVVRSDYIPRIQEVQGTIYHLMRRGLDLLGRSAA